jgi:hypothetical protein
LFSPIAYLHFAPHLAAGVGFVAHVKTAWSGRRAVWARFDVDQYTRTTVFVELSAWRQVIQFASATVFNKKTIASVRD